MSNSAIVPHPKGTKARILLTSVFGPFARDDEFGSRRNNPMELYHNQVTRLQGGFSLRMFHRSFGLLMLQANIDAPCTVLDFPTLESFMDEVRKTPYDIVGIGAIGPNVEKVKAMCAIIRRERPGATIVVGGHVAARPDLPEIIDADHIVRGDGISWFRTFLGQDEKLPVRHPMVLSGFGARIMGIDLPKKKGRTAAILIPSVGCPVGCNFCSTSALFGGKGNFVNFYETGDDSLLRHVPDRRRACREFLLRPGRKFPPAQAAGLAPARADAGRRKELGALRFQLCPGPLVLFHRAARGAGHRLGVDGP